MTLEYRKGMAMISRMAIVILLLLSGTLAGQDVRRAIMEEIRSAPAGESGKWKFGESIEIESNSATQINKRTGTKNEELVGQVAIVEFIVKDRKYIATVIQPMAFKAVDVNDGPYVFWKDKSTAEVITMTKGKVNRKTYKDITKPLVVDKLPGVVKSITLDPNQPAVPKSTWAQPEKLMAISDLEGNYENAVKFLSASKLIDKEGNWIWGNGHLVLVGDLVDRGDQVTELMWLLRRLERQAQKAGGQVHYILGNHEAMVMGGDLRYIHPKYHFVTARMRSRYDLLFATNTEIGRWWRSKNGAETVGDLLFIHGGYSPQLDKAQLELKTLNQRVRAGLPPARPTGVTADTNPVLHQHGPFWYRGYFAEYAAGWGGQATEKEIQAILDRHKSKHIVIGHTVVDQIKALNKSGQVIAIDVKWADAQKCEGLLQENGKLWRVKMNGSKEELKVGE